jgi:hypothetical protein
MMIILTLRIAMPRAGLLHQNNVTFDGQVAALTVAMTATITILIITIIITVDARSEAHTVLDPSNIAIVGSNTR